MESVGCGKDTGNLMLKSIGKFEIVCNKYTNNFSPKSLKFVNYLPRYFPVFMNDRNKLN